MAGKDIIIFGGIDWDGKRKLPIHHVAERLNRKNRVFYIDNFGGVRDLSISDISRATDKLFNSMLKRKNILSSKKMVTVVRPIVIPTARLPFLLGKINVAILTNVLGRMMRDNIIRRPVVWTRVGTNLVWQSIMGIREKLLVYQVVENFPYSPKINRSLRSRFIESDMKFCKFSDLIFASARGLAEMKRNINSKTFFFPNGVDSDVMRRMREESRCKNIPGPIVGFVGAVASWVDCELLLKVAKMRPEYSFVILGPIAEEVDISSFRGLSNVHIEGVVSYENLPMWYSSFSVGLIPYKVNEFTQYTFPSKMAEYLAMGMPVVSTQLPEVMAYSDIVYITRNAEEMCRAIDRAIEGGFENEKMRKRKLMAESLSWDKIVSDMEELVDKAWETKFGQ